MAKKLRLTSAEKQMFQDALNNLPNLPRIDNLGNVIPARKTIIASTLIEYYHELIKEGYNLPELATLYKNEEQYWNVGVIAYVDKEKRMRKALLAGTLQEEVKKYNAEYELFTKRQIELKTPEEHETLTQEEKVKERDEFYQKEKLAEKKRLGHTRKRYHN